MKLNVRKFSIHRVLLTLFFLTLGVGQLQRIQLTQQIAVYIHELILLSCLLIFLPKLVREYKAIFSYTQKYRFIALLVAFLFLQTIVYQIVSFQIVAILYLLRLWLYFQILVIIKIALLEKILTKKDIFVLVVSISSIIAVLGLAQYIFFPDTRSLILMGWDDHYYRLISTLFDPGFTGLIISIGFFTYLFHFYKQTRVENICLSGVFILSILLTYSRASYIALVVGMLSLLYLTKQKMYLVIILIFCLGIPLLPRPTGEGTKLERTASISSRISSNRQALQTLSLSEVIWGRGFYRNITESKNGLPNHAVAPDNSFIFIFVSIGMIGVFLLGATLYQIRKSFSNKLLSTLLLVIGTHSLFNNSLFYIWTMAMFFAVAATTFSASKYEE